MYNCDPVSVKNLNLHHCDAPNFPEQVYDASCGHETGMSTVGFRSGRYMPQESSDLFNTRHKQVDLDNHHSASTRNDMDDMIKESAALQKKNLFNTTERLKERITDINFWKIELEREIREIINITDKLERRRNQMQGGLFELNQSIHIATDNLNARQRRYGEDHIQDDVELQLLKELDILNKAVTLYKKSIDQIDKQTKRNLDVKQDLEMIWSDKKISDELMTTSVKLNPKSTNKQYYHGETRRHPLAMQSTMESWGQHTHDNIMRADHERLASEQLYQLTENIIHDVVRDVTNQKDIVNMTFQKNLDEMERLKFDLTSKLKNTTMEIGRMERAIQELRDAISEKEDYLKVVQTRLHLHNQRPAVENTRDNAQISVLSESCDLERVLDKLNEELIVAENNLKHLQDDQMMLEKQIQQKTNSIQIDRDHCVRHRAIFPNSVKLTGHPASSCK